MSCSIDIVIVNWNAGGRLRGCLQSIAEADSSGFKLDNVIVVDNASSDGSTQNLENINLPLQVIRNSKNIGFAGACNQGAENSKTDYLLFLNPDTRLFPDSLSIPLSFMELAENAGIGICGIKLVDEVGQPTTSCARFPTAGVLFGKITGLSRILPSYFKDHLMTANESSRSGVVDQVIGAFFLVRSELYFKLNGFDERYFVYFEEVDFSLRAKKSGFVSYLLTETSALHAGGACSVQAGSNRLFYYLRSRILYGMKNFTLSENIVLFFLTLVIEPIARLFSSLRKGSIKAVRDDFAAYGKLLGFLVIQSR